MAICNFVQKLIINDQTPFKMADFINIFKLIKILVVRQEFCQKYGISKNKFQVSGGKFIGPNQSFKGVFCLILTSVCIFFYPMYAFVLPKTSIKWLIFFA